MDPLVLMGPHLLVGYFATRMEMCGGRTQGTGVGAPLHAPNSGVS
ncbi:hypothetical protein LINGRAHAP2_LOCUS20883 [Linum grandiflorum]